MTPIRLLFTLFVLLLPLTSGAHKFVVRQPVPPVGIGDKGELLWQQDKFSEQDWDSAGQPGKVRVIQHIAGRSSSREKNIALIEAIKAARFPPDRYQITTLVNTDDAIRGTGMFVRSSIESS